MTTKITDAPKRKSPMSPLEVEKFRAAVLSMITKEKIGCVKMAEHFKLNQRTMMTHLRFMQQVGLIHSKPQPGGGRIEYMWYVGPGECAPRIYKEKPYIEPVVKQLRVKKWPPTSFPKQTIFSSLGL